MVETIGIGPEKGAKNTREAKKNMKGLDALLDIPYISKPDFNIREGDQKELKKLPNDSKELREVRGKIKTGFITSDDLIGASPDGGKPTDRDGEKSILDKKLTRGEFIGAAGVVVTTVAAVVGEAKYGFFEKLWRLFKESTEETPEDKGLISKEAMSMIERRRKEVIEKASQRGMNEEEINVKLEKFEKYIADGNLPGSEYIDSLFEEEQK